jgi:hypothetical protein
MKKNYLLITLALALIVNATSVNAADFLVRKNVTSNSSVASPTEAFYTHLTSLPYQPADSVDMSNSTFAPTTYFSCFGTSYPTKGYKVILATPGTITLYASSNNVSVGNFAFVITTHYDLRDYVYLSTGNGTSGTLSAGTYYFTLLTNQKYGKFKLSVTSTATITTENTSSEVENIRIYAERNVIIAKGLSPNTEVNVYSMNGQLLKSVASTSQTEEINVPNKGIYFVKFNGISKKVIVL